MFTVQNKTVLVSGVAIPIIGALAAGYSYADREKVVGQ